MSARRDLYLDGGRPARTQEKCACCGERSGVFFAAAGKGQAWFHCVSITRKNLCGRYFVAVAPKPLKRKVP